MVLDWGIKKKEAEQDCGNEKVFSESLNSGLDGSPSYCQESPHVRSCGSFHQPEPEPVAMDNSAWVFWDLQLQSSSASGDFFSCSVFICSLIEKHKEAVGSKFIWSVDNDEQKASFPFVHFGMLSSDSRMYGLRKFDDFMAGRVIVLN
ncbi:hypothetical protein CUMW_260070 [Citrus unshiu]|nr:hypothetical protein CUMW_260070 [Citrus unshiu]